MTVVNPKSISGINSITTGSGSDNLLTIHTSDASNTERVRINSSGDVIVGSGITVSPDGDIFTTGVTTATTIKSNTGIVTTLTSTTFNVDGGDATFKGTTSGRDVVFDTSLNQIRAQDNAKLCAGTSSDLEIYHNATNSFLDNYTGALFLRNNVSSDNGGNIVIQAKVNEDSIVCNDDGAVELYYDNSKKFETNTNGNQVTGQLVVPDGGNNTGNNNITFGSDNDCHVYHNGTDFYMVNTTGKLDLRAKAGEKSIVANPDGAVELYHDNTKQCETSANGLAFPSGKGIDFSAGGNANGMTSELLDDYEEGHFDAINNYNTVWYSNQNKCSYTKIGRQVTVTGQIRQSSGSGDLILGLPFSIATNSSGESEFSGVGSLGIYEQNTTSTAVSVHVLANGGDSFCYFMESFDNIQWNHLETDAAAYLRFTFTYFTT